MARRSNRQYSGLLVIGDPHIEGRQPGHRCDDYPNVILDKVQWCLSYAVRQNLLPVFLGDFFDKPRDNPIWLVGRLIEMLLKTEAVGIYGNHDCAETSLNENDSLTILVKSGCLRLVSESDPWTGTVGGRQAVIGGSSYRAPIPEAVRVPPAPTLFEETDPFVVWLAHHDISVPGYEAGRFSPYEIENCDLLINGHIHTRKQPVQCGRTLWLTPGNISRRTRKDATREQIPQVLQVDVNDDTYQLSDVVIPHRPYDEVFHAAIVDDVDENATSGFVAGLRELMSRRTESGAGLHEFLEQNLDSFEPAVATEIRQLAAEVTESPAIESQTSN